MRRHRSAGPAGARQPAKIAASVLAVNTGSRPDAAMAVAVVAAFRDLARTNGPHTLAVVTGGSDSCNTQAGQLIATGAKKDGLDYQVYVVGFQIPDSQGDSLSGLVDSAGNGHYVNVHTKAELTTVLTAIQQYANNPNATTVSSVVATAAALPTSTAAPPTSAFGLTACDNQTCPCAGMPLGAIKTPPAQTSRGL